MSPRIVPLRVGRSRNVPMEAAVYGHPHGETVDIIMFMFVVEAGDRLILVDSGTLDPEYVRRYHPYDFARDPDSEPSIVLREHGYDPADFDTVVNTHLHWDHCSNNGMFPNARVLVNKKELEYAIDPLPIHRRAYEKLPGIQAPWMAAWDRIETVTGEHRICPGVTVVPLPGHTPGSQGVLVETGGGRYLIAGDALGVYENWNTEDWRDSVPPTIHTNVIECFETFEYIASLSCEVIPSHDGRIAEVYS
ncbi:N-acyl homoserine lactonase family protein [Spongiactinospora sp. 9N601]|uniref:N-acyl homoserine lactonase family protein n=1 Tax=Spongiactinospora sp. 9N601 TaxID=3375149 RepID=UPI0037A7D3E1